MEKRMYPVSEAEKLTGEKAHVLRYWEEELGMDIHRNSLGHRYYTEQDIQIFLGIRELKKKGLHLKAIRELMPRLVQVTEKRMELQETPLKKTELERSGEEGRIEEKREREEQDEKSEQIAEKRSDSLTEKETESLADVVMREKEEERQAKFYQLLGQLLDQMVQRRRQEERSRRVDEAIRRHQQSRREAAATLEQKGKKIKKKNAG